MAAGARVAIDRRPENLYRKHAFDFMSAAQCGVDPFDQSGHSVIVVIAAVHDMGLRPGAVRPRSRSDVREAGRESRGRRDPDVERFAVDLMESRGIDARASLDIAIAQPRSREEQTLARLGDRGIE